MRFHKNAPESRGPATSHSRTAAWKVARDRARHPDWAALASTGMLPPSAPPARDGQRSGPHITGA